MGTRALRKLREQEWEKQLAASRSQDEEEEESEEEPVIISNPRNAFDMLDDAEGDDEEAEEVADAHKEESQLVTDIQPLAQSSTPKSKKKKKKPKKQQKAQINESKDVSEDEIDKALQELSLKQPAQDSNVVDQDAVWEKEATKHLAIESRNLDPVNEMRGLFGNIALEEDTRRSQPARRREQNLQGVDLQTALSGRYNRASRGKELGNLAKRRNCFMQGKEEWPLSTSGGLSMEAVAVTSFDKQYNFVHNQQYKNAQWEFKVAVESGQPEQIIKLLQLYPYHISSLLQVSEIAKYQGDSSLSGDLLERALFTFGRSVHSSFPQAMREGVARLNFNKPANRELYLAIWRYLRNLEQRGTWKTAYEWSKILLQLNTISDPFGVTLMVDQLALRGRQHDQFLAMVSDSAYGPAWSHLPNICISRSLALLRAQKPKEARQQLALAMHRYPYILSALASAIEVSPIPKSIWGKLPSTDAEKLYSELYVTRAKDLWNTPETIGLISEVANTIQYYKAFIDSHPPAASLQISLEEARHVMALEIPALIALLPRKFTTMPTSSTDILPPPDSEQSDLVRRAPAQVNGTGDDPGLATVTMDLIQRALGWFYGSANPDDGATDEPQNRQEDIQAFRAALGPEAEGMSDEQVTQYVMEELLDSGQLGGPPEQQATEMQPSAIDAREVLAALQQQQMMHQNAANPQEAFDRIMEEVQQQRTGRTAMAGPMAGGWNYYDSHGNRPHADSDDDSDEMPDLVGGSAEPQPMRRPHAATVEEADSDDEDNVGSRRPARSTGPILRHMDSDDEDTTQPAAHSAASRRPQTQPQPAAARATPVSPPIDVDIEDDPQRLQRWLIGTGVQELKADGNMITYVRRTKKLRPAQQIWVLNMLKQRGEADLAKRVQEALG